MHCPNCGNAVGADDLYCTACGALLPTPQTKHRNRIGAILKAIGIAVLACAVYYAVQYGAVLIWQLRYIASSKNSGMITYDELLSAFNEASEYLTIIINAVTLLMIAVFLRLRRSSLADSAGWRGAPASRTLAALVTGAAMQLAVILVVLFLPIPESVLTDHAEFMESSASLGVQLICGAIAAPILEETLFRGIIYSRARSAMGKPAALIFSALVFAVMHGDLMAAVNAFFFGLLFGILYDRFDSVLVPMAFHAGFNAAAYLIPESLDSLLMLAACFASAGIAVIGFYLIFRKEPKESQK